MGTTVVRLFIDEDTSTPEQGLVADLTELIADEPRMVELVPEAGSLDIRYLLAIGGYHRRVDAQVDLQSSSPSHRVDARAEPDR